MLSTLALLASLLFIPQASTARDLDVVRELRKADPGHPALLLEYAQALGKSGDADGETAYSLYALEALELEEPDEEQIKAKEIALKIHGKRIRKLDPACFGLTAKRDAYLKDLEWVLRLYSKNQKKYRNALELSGRILRHRPTHRLARRTLGEIMETADRKLKTEAERLLGFKELRRSRSYRNKWSKEHQKWARSETLENSGYIVRTNIGYDTLHRAAGSLKRISNFYRDFYGVDTSDQVGKTHVYLCRTREEFERIARMPDLTKNPGLKGFLVTQPTSAKKTSHGFRYGFRFELYSYDPRDEGAPLAGLYSTLFHEASHQYMALAVGANGPPGWLNEGMATYFEGVELGEGGEVLIGLPAKQRMQQLYGTLCKKERPLKATINTSKLSGVQYPVAWGLVYYLYHHQLEDGTHPYRRILRDGIQYARKYKVDGMGVFIAACLPTTGLDFDEFETQWIEAMLKLAELEGNREEAANHYRAKAIHFLEIGNLAAARDAFHDTLLRAPGDVDALLGLARTTSDSEERVDEDNTLLWSRRAHRAAVQANNEPAEKQALALASKTDKAGFRRLLKVENRYRKKVMKLVELRISEGKPQTALAITRRYLDNVLGEDHFSALSQRLRDEGLFDLKRTIRVFDGKTLFGLSASPSSFRVKSGYLEANPQRPARAPVGISEPVSPRMRFEGELHLGNSNAMVSFLLSTGGAASNHGFVIRPAEVKGSKQPGKMYYPFDPLAAGHLAHLVESYNEKSNYFDYTLQDSRINPVPPPVGEWVAFALDTTVPGVLVLELGGKEVARQDMPSSNEVRPSLLLYGGPTKLRGLRVVELDKP